MICLARPPCGSRDLYGTPDGSRDRDGLPRRFVSRAAARGLPVVDLPLLDAVGRGAVFGTHDS